MNYRQVEYFIAAAEHEHFNHAAQTFHVSQPSLSQQIKLLEEELGVKLFDRIGRNIKLSEAGRNFLPYAKRSLEILDEGVSAVQKLKQGLVGSVTIGVIQTVNAYFIPKLTAQFISDYPHVNLKVIEGTADWIEKSLEKGLIDLGVSFGPNTSKHLSSVELFKENFMVIGSKSNQLFTEKAPVTLKQTCDNSMVLLPNEYCTRRVVDSAVSDKNLKLNISLEVSSIETILKMVSTNNLVTILPQLALQNCPFTLQSRLLKNPAIQRTVVLLARKNTNIYQPAYQFSKNLIEAAKELRTADK